MKNFKKTLCGLLFGLAGFGAVAATVSDVKARQRYPWNGKIDIDYTITGTDTTNTALAVTLTDNDTGNVYSFTEGGRHQFTWNKTDLVVSNVTATVSLVSYNIPTVAKELYCVIDLLGGPDATRWPVSYLATVPIGGWTDDYKTTKLVLRRIEVGTFIMGDDQTDESHRVTLTKPFYMGVFEVTQRQFELIMGPWPNPFYTTWGLGETYPAYCVSYDDIRGPSLGAQWPASSTVDALSFLGKLRTKTGLDFDLPTEAQWEYACRAGMATTYYWGDSMDGTYAWYEDNSDNKTHPVGTKEPNAWGLYDMSGNMAEVCRDRYGIPVYGTDPVGSASGSNRVCRGGGWGHYADRCTSSFRYGTEPFSYPGNSGFRLVVLLSD